MGGAAFATINQALSDWDSENTTDVGLFNAAAAALAMEDTTLTYGVPSTITAGEKLFVAAHACYLNGITEAPVDAKTMDATQITAFQKAFTDSS